MISDNIVALQTNLAQQIAAAENAANNWANLSAAQKDAVALAVLKGVARLARLYLGQFDSSGV